LLKKIHLLIKLIFLFKRYLNFIRGVVDSDDLPLNVSRETLQQNKLLKVIKKKLVRKILDMIKKLTEEDFNLFWKEYGTNIKLGVIEDTNNRNRLAKLLRFQSSATETEKTTSLEKYIERMKEKQEFIYFIAGTSRDELAKSPFVEKLLKKGLEVLNSHLKERIENVKVSTRLVKTPMALIANQYGYSGNMERITRAQAYQKSGGDSASNYYFGQKKILEVNPGHPLIKELLRRVEANGNDQKAKDLVELMFESATLRSGYELRDTAGFADRIESKIK